MSQTQTPGRGEHGPTPDLRPLIDKLVEQFPPVDAESLGADYVSNPIASAALALSGIPIEQFADRLHRYYLDRTVRELNRLRQTDVPWSTGNWVLVAPPYLLPGCTYLSGVQVIHNPLCPDWQVFLVRSPEWWSDQIRNQPATTWRPTPEHDVKTDLMALYRSLHRPTRPPHIDPPDDPQPFVRITGV